MSDLISRQAVLDAIFDSKNFKNEFDRGFFIDRIRDIPSAEKTGHWIDKEVRGSIVPYCSECGEGLDVIYHYDFCPNCGARMVESQESEDKICKYYLECDGCDGYCSMYEP